MDRSYNACPRAYCTTVVLYIPDTAFMCWPSVKWKITTGPSTTSNPIFCNHRSGFYSQHAVPRNYTKNLQPDLRCCGFSSLFRAGSQLLLPIKEQSVKHRRVNVRLHLNFKSTRSLKVFRSKAMTLFASELLAWHLWRPDWWKNVHTCSHFLLATSSDLLTSLLHALQIKAWIVLPLAQTERKGI